MFTLTLPLPNAHFLFFKTQAEIDAAQEEASRPTRNFNFDPKYLIIPLLLFICYLIWNAQSDKSLDLMDEKVTSKHFGFEMNIGEITTFQAMAIQKIFTELSAIKNESYTEDDMKKLGKVLNNPGALIEDISLLQWALNFLERIKGNHDLENLIISKICDVFKNKFNICGNAKQQEDKKKNNGKIDLPDEAQLSDIEISVRLYNILMTERGPGEFPTIKTVGDLRKVAEDDWFSKLIRVRYAGRKIIEEFRELLERIKK